MGETKRQQPSIPGFELITVIGTGSYGDVWLAVDGEGNHRAVKVVYRDRFDHERPFDREFRGIKRIDSLEIQHETLLRVFEIATSLEGGFFYYAMELADDRGGASHVDSKTYAPRTLRSDIMDRGRFPIDECIDIGIELADGLALLHQNRLVHRDVKPGNVIFVAGKPKLADVGLVMGFDESLSLVGTPGFLPLDGGGTPQADLYALGKTLYEMNTGKNCHEYPAPATELDGSSAWRVQGEFDRVVFTACHREPEARYGDAQALRADLLAVKLGRTMVEGAKIRWRLMRARVIGGVLGVMLLLLLGGLVWQRVEGLKDIQEEIRFDAILSNGVALEAQGLNQEAIAAFATGLRLENRPTRVQSTKLRLASSLDATPRMIHRWNLGSSVNATVFSPDLDWLAACTEEGKLWILHCQNDWRRVVDLSFPGVTLERVAFSRDSKRIVLSGLEGSAWIWELDSDSLVWRGPTKQLIHPKAIYDAQFSPSGSHVVTACRDGLVRLWALEDERLLAEWLPDQWSDSWPRCVNFNRAGDLIATGTQRPKPESYPSAGRVRGEMSPIPGQASTWQVSFQEREPGLESVAQELRGVDSRQSVRDFPHSAALENWVYSVEFSPDDQLLATCSSDATVAVWKVKSGDLMYRLNHDSIVRSVRFSPSGKFLIASCFDRSVTIWNASNGQPASPSIGLENAPNYADMATRLGVAVVADAGGWLSLWALPEGSFGIDGDRSGTEPDGALARRDSRVLVGLKNRYAVEHSLDGKVTRIDLTSRARSTPWTLPENMIVEDIDSRGERLISRDGNAITIRAAINGEILYRFETKGAPEQVEFLPAGPRLMSVEREVTQIIDPENPSAPLRLPHDFSSDRIRPPVVNDTETRVVGFRGNKANLYSLSESIRLIQELSHDQVVSVAAFSPDNGTLATATIEGSKQRCYVQRWRTENGDPVGQRLWHADGILSLVFSPDGTLLAGGAEDGSVSVWRVSNGERLLVLAHRDRAYEVAFDSEGKWLAVATAAGYCRVWDVLSGRPLTPELGAGWPCSDVRFIEIRDDTTLVALRYSGFSRWWEFGLDRSEAALVEWAQAVENPPSDDVGWERLRERYPGRYALPLHSE